MVQMRNGCSRINRGPLLKKCIIIFSTSLLFIGGGFDLEGCAELICVFLLFLIVVSFFCE